MAFKQGYRLRDMSRVGVTALVVTVLGLGLLWASTLLDFRLPGLWAVVALVIAGMVTIFVSERRRLRREGRPFLSE